jgi:hypothetical protein
MHWKHRGNFWLAFRVIKSLAEAAGSPYRFIESGFAITAGFAFPKKSIMISMNN